MVIPDYQSVMLPLLKYAEDGREHHIRDAIEELAKEFKLNEEERKELLPSGQQTIFKNRVGWANTYLKKAELLDSGKKGYFSITRRGLDVLREKPLYIDVSFLKRDKEFNEFYNKDKQVLTDKQDVSEVEGKKALDSEESLEIA